MILCPRFAISAFIFANDDDRNISLLRRIYRSLNRSGLRLWVDELHVVSPPPAETLWRGRYLAAFGIEHLHLIAHFGLDAIQHAHAVTGIAAIPAQMHVGGVRSDDCN